MSGYDDLLPHRLDRIEQKIDKMTESLIAIARAEEKIAKIEQDRLTQLEREDEQNKRMSKLSDTVNSLVVTVDQNQKAFKRLNGIIGSVALVLLAAAANAYFDLIPIG